MSQTSDHGRTLRTPGQAAPLTVVSLRDKGFTRYSTGTVSFRGGSEIGTSLVELFSDGFVGLASIGKFPGRVRTQVPCGK